MTCLLESDRRLICGLNIKGIREVIVFSRIVKEPEFKEYSISSVSSAENNTHVGGNRRIHIRGIRNLGYIGDFALL
jgi:hypothetical protein